MSDRHYTVVVEVKETTEPHPVVDGNGYQAKGAGGSTLMTERRVVDRLRVVVSAGDEPEAIQRAIDMLAAAQS
jgi:hypothetical protein